MAQGQGYGYEPGQPTSFRAPGFPFFLAGIYRIAGLNYLVAYLSFCLLGAISCLATYLLARELLPESGARLAAILAAIYPPHIFFATGFCSENVFVPCLGLGLFLFVRYLKSGGLGILVGAGLALGWATLTRPFALLLLPGLLCILAWYRFRVGLRLGSALLFGVAFMAPIIPWTARNYSVHGRLVLVATNGGSTFYGGNNDRVVTEPRHFGDWVSTVTLPHRDIIDATSDEVAHDQIQWRLGFQWIRENPRQVPLLCVLKMARLWFWLPDVDLANGNKLARAACYLPFVPLFFIGIARCLRDRSYWTAPWMVVHGTLLATMLTGLIFWGSPRFRDADLPVLMIYAALAAGPLFARWFTKSKQGFIRAEDLSEVTQRSWTPLKQDKADSEFSIAKNVS
jgi:4-amino-4-deoxy-L-arabinose transferase-like glycosyltransferase